jgi:hypothetical protein
MNRSGHLNRTLSVLLTASLLIGSVSASGLVVPDCAACCCRMQQDGAKNCSHCGGPEQSCCPLLAPELSTCCAVKSHNEASPIRSRVTKRCPCSLQQHPLPVGLPCQTDKASQLQWLKLTVQFAAACVPREPVDVEVVPPGYDVELLVRSHSATQAVLGIWLT